MSVATGAPEEMEVPRSPVAVRPSASTYCWAGLWSSPSRSRSASACAGSTPAPPVPASSMMLAGSLGSR